MIVVKLVYCCLIQRDNTPLQVAIRNKAAAVVYLLIVDYNQQTSHLSLVSNHILCMIATISANNHVALTSLPNSITYICLELHYCYNDLF